MKMRLHVVVEGTEQVAEDLKVKLTQLQENLSYSPTREQPSLNNCCEFFCTADLTLDEIIALKSQLNNDWEGVEDDCDAYGFNTQMYDPCMYYVQIQY